MIILFSNNEKSFTDLSESIAQFGLINCMTK